MSQNSSVKQNLQPVLRLLTAESLVPPTPRKTIDGAADDTCKAQRGRVRPSVPQNQNRRRPCRQVFEFVTGQS